MDHGADEIIPDDRDWTWVLDRPCPECGFEASEFDPAETGSAIRDNADAWEAVLDADPTALRTRRRPDRWSDLEYAAHVRDVFQLYLERLTMMRELDDPLYPNWDQDATAISDAYRDQDPAVVRVELVEAAGRLADAFDTLRDDEWLRRGRRSDGASFTIDSFARYLVHDPVHHLWDVNH